ncbi:hypothetical protein ACHAXN_000911 [Cyclotella atomus]
MTTSHPHGQRKHQQLSMPTICPVLVLLSITCMLWLASQSSRPPGSQPSRPATTPAGLVSPMPMPPNTAPPVMKPSKTTYHKCGKASDPPNRKYHPLSRQPSSRLSGTSIQRNVYLDRTHQQGLHGRHGLLSNMISQRQPIHYASIPLRLQCHSGGTLSIPQRPSLHSSLHPSHDSLESNVLTFPPDIHRCNLAKRATQTFKAHFLAILSGLSKAFPNYLWDKLLPQTELTLNLLCQSSIAPAMSAREYYNKAPFNFDATPIGP